MRRSLIPFSIISVLLTLASAQGHFTSTTAGGLTVYTTPAEPPIAGMPSGLFLELRDVQNNPITKLDLVHERKLHVFVVSADLSTFAHIHPEDNPNGYALTGQGVYILNYTYPYTGAYLVVADYTTGGVNTVTAASMPVLGDKPMPPPVFDFNTTKTFDGYTVTIEAPARIDAKEEVQLTFHIEKDDAPVRDLQMYLGAEMHVLAVRADLQYAGHTHPYAPGHSLHLGTMQQRYIGPNVPIRYTFPEPGVYAVFGQFQEQDHVTTTRFLVRVEPPDNLTDSEYANERRNANILSQGSEIIVFILAMAILFPLAFWYEKRREKKKEGKKN